MIRRTPAILALPVLLPLLAAAPLCAQARDQDPPAGVDPTQVPRGSKYALPTAAPKEKPFSRPFRFFQPKTSFELSKDWQALLADAHEMYRLWRDSPDRSFDRDGLPTASTKHYATLRERITPLLARQGGMLRSYRMDETAAARRQAWAFLSLFVTPRQDAVDLLRGLPYEPDAAVRKSMIELSIPFLAACARATEDGQQGTAKYFVDAAPWMDLTRSPETRDRILALSALAEIAGARPVATKAVLPYMKRWYPDLLRSKSELLRNKAREFITLLEPQARFPSDIDASADYFDRVYKLLFPPIRLDKGRCELHPSAELDAAIELGRELLNDASATKRESVVVRTKRATFEKLGVRLLRVPEALESAGFHVGDVLTTLNGQPIGSAAQMLGTIEKILEAGSRRFVLEWVDAKGVEHVRTYEVMAPDSDG
ncbi:MAG: hypothetical protein KDC95_03215 [Planctomycetes bacterium]|nr:hypothetical protein [Planctomycetota bacterium]